jgi:NADPH:quinone reductase-like Zn-dependent oxidoreductase
MIGDVLLRVVAASLTLTELEWPSQWVDRRGLDRLPVIPCHEVCGVVSALGYGTSGFEVGDEVFGVTDWYRDGAAADYVAVEARNLAPRPKGCSSLEAAALPLAGLTAWQALFEHGRLKPHQSVLITGATGGVGVFAVQLARAGGARVHAAGHAAHAAVATELGAEVFVDLDHEDWVKEVGQVDLVYDLVGGEVLDRVVQAKIGTRVVSMVAPHEGVDFFVVEPNRDTLSELARRADTGTLRPVVSDVVPLVEGARAFDRARDSAGKRVLLVTDD